MSRALAILVLCTLLPAQDKPPTAPERIASMSWLAGAWKGPMWGGTWVTQYSTPEGSLILSTSKLISGGKVSMFEFERFGVRGGSVFLTPYPGGRPAATFKATKIEKNKAVFENPDKDFPTRITYWRAAADSLVITLDDPHGKSGKLAKFDLKKTP